MKALILGICFVFWVGGVSAQTPAWQPSPGHTQVAIWPGAPPDRGLSRAGDRHNDGEGVGAGRPWVAVEQRFAAYDDSLSANGKEYGRGGGGVSRRGL